jgi:hypothetical protein
VINRYVGNLPPMPGVFPDYPAPVIRNTDTGRELGLPRATVVIRSPAPIEVLRLLCHLSSLSQGCLGVETKNY